MCDTSGTHEHGGAGCTCDTSTNEHVQEHGHADEHGTSAATAGIVNAAYGVEGMTCSHCVSSVTEELGRLDGVKNINVELVAGGVSRVSVASDAALDPDQVAAAIDEAGYALADLTR